MSGRDLGFVSGILPSTNDPIEPGTKSPFFQAAAPLFWTQDTGNTDAMLRVVSGTGGGTGGSVSATTGLTSTDSHTLITSEMPAHTHTQRARNIVSGAAAGVIQASAVPDSNAGETLTTGGGGGHTHTITHAPKFIDMIICSFNG